jgi:hypothetical protein
MADPQIITEQDEFNSIRGYLGLDPVDFTDPTMQGLMFIPAAELVIRKLVNKMSADTDGAVPTVAQIIHTPSPTPPATDDDLLALKLAVVAYVSFQFTPGSTNAVNVSTTVGKITVDRGGLGTQWTAQRDMAMEQAGMWLAMITGWPEATQNDFVFSGPISSGSRPNNLSGFW